MLGIKVSKHGNLQLLLQEQKRIGQSPIWMSTLYMPCINDEFKVSGFFSMAWMYQSTEPDRQANTLKNHHNLADEDQLA